MVQMEPAALPGPADSIAEINNPMCAYESCLEIPIWFQVNVLRKEYATLQLEFSMRAALQDYITAATFWSLHYVNCRKLRNV